MADRPDPAEELGQHARPALFEVILDRIRCERHPSPMMIRNAVAVAEHPSQLEALLGVLISGQTHRHLSPMMIAAINEVAALAPPRPPRPGLRASVRAAAHPSTPARPAHAVAARPATLAHRATTPPRVSKAAADLDEVASLLDETAELLTN